jgi:hypothetical protein
MNKKLFKLKLADVVAVPCLGGNHAFMIFVCKNQWGYGFGVFKESSSSTAPPNELSASGVPIYTELSPIKSGRWSIVANRPDLLCQFPPTLPIYHAKRDNIANDLIGKYGSSESEDGEIKSLTEMEANQFGLTDGSYRQIRIESEVETYLNSVIHLHNKEKSR